MKRYLRKPAICAASALSFALLGSLSARADVGTWSLITTPFPSANSPSVMAQLTDGTILVQGAGTTLPALWKRLKPDAQGVYATGTWTSVKNALQAKLYFAALTLPDGRLFTAGGEYSSGGDQTNDVEIYDPLVNTWTKVPPPTGWAHIGDSPTILLPNGKVMIGANFDRTTMLFDPVSQKWTAGPNILSPAVSSSENAWHLMVDGTVVTLAMYGPKPQVGQKYDYLTNTWYAAGGVIQDVGSAIPGIVPEVGPEFLLPNGNLIAFGANGNNALYTPGASLSDPGIWSEAPSMPSTTEDGIQAMVDSPGAMMSNLKILISTAPVLDGKDFYGPVSFFEFDPMTFAFTPAGTPLAKSDEVLPYLGNMLVAPDGRTLWTSGGDTSINAYTPTVNTNTGGFTGKPVVKSVAINKDNSYLVTGTGLNGISHGAVYGDEATPFTSFPIVRIFNPANGKVWYARTYGRSFCGIATGALLITTRFDLPSGLDTGTLKLQVVANGIASDAVNFLPKSKTGVNVACGSTVALGVFAKDTYFTGGTTAKLNTTGLVNMSKVTPPVPHAAYLSERNGSSFSYRFTGLAKNATYTVNLFFTENTFNASGKRTFNVAMNGVSKLSAYDIYAHAKAQRTAIETISTIASDASGVIQIDFAGVVGLAKVDAIQLQK